MVEYVAYGYNLCWPEKEAIKKMMAILQKDTKGIIHDLSTHDLDSSPDAVCLIFGEQAKERCKQLKCANRIEFPDVWKLVQGLGNEEDRRVAYETLLSFKDNTGGQFAIEGKKNGKVVRISKEKAEQAEVNLTPEELSLLQLAKEVLQIEDFRIVGTNSNSYRKDSGNRTSTNSSERNAHNS